MILFDGPITSIDQMIEVMFGTLRHMSEEGIDSRILFQTGEGSLRYITQLILDDIDDAEKQSKLINRINTRFMDLLSDYNQVPIWNLLKDFQKQFPVCHQN